jgi:hypothetical protein
MDFFCLFPLLLADVPTRSYLLGLLDRMSELSPPFQFIFFMKVVVVVVKLASDIEQRYLSVLVDGLLK